MCHDSTHLKSWYRCLIPLFCLLYFSKILRKKNHWAYIGKDVRRNTHWLLIGHVPSQFLCSITITWPWYSPASCIVDPFFVSCLYIFVIYRFHSLTSFAASIRNTSRITCSNCSSNKNATHFYKSKKLFNFLLSYSYHFFQFNILSSLLLEQYL